MEPREIATWCAIIITMQNQWVGDDGDILKLGLLRHLVQLCGDAVNPLGVNWYMATPKPRESPTPPDQVLLDRLSELRAAPRRTVADLQGSGLLGDAKFFNVPVPPKSKRKAWHQQARTALAGCPAVFLDPDNGVQPGCGNRRHVLWRELKCWWENGARTVIVFQHARREPDVAARIAESINTQLGAASTLEPIRRKNRWMYVIPPSATRERATIEEAVFTFRERWKEWLG